MARGVGVGQTTSSFGGIETVPRYTAAQPNSPLEDAPPALPSDSWAICRPTMSTPRAPPERDILTTTPKIKVEKCTCGNLQREQLSEIGRLRTSLVTRI